MRFEALRAISGIPSWIVVDTHKQGTTEMGRTVSRYPVEPTYWTEEQAEQKANETAKHLNKTVKS